jgi:Domain of unknown function (DUF397)
MTSGAAVTGADDHSGETAAGPSALDAACWMKSSWSTHAGNCVEVAKLPERTVGVRDSKDNGPIPAVLTFSRPAWNYFLAGVKTKEFDF